MQQKCTIRQNNKRDKDWYQTTYFLQHQSPLFLYKRNLSYLSMTLLQSKPQSLIFYWNNTAELKSGFLGAKQESINCSPHWQEVLGQMLSHPTTRLQRCRHSSHGHVLSGWVNKNSTKDGHQKCLHFMFSTFDFGTYLLSLFLNCKMELILHSQDELSSTIYIGQKQSFCLLIRPLYYCSNTICKRSSRHMLPVCTPNTDFLSLVELEF